MAPTQPARAHSQKDLPPSVESAYYRKCIDLRRRINDIEESNDSTRQRILRLNRGVQKMRLERAFLLEQLNKHMEYNIDDSDRSSSPPPTPTDKPLRSRRSLNRKGTPPAGTAGGHQSVLQSNLMSSAQSTPEPGRVSGNYFNTVGAPGTSPQPVNGAPVLPPLNSLPSLQPSLARAPESTRAYFDPAYDDQRPVPAAENEADSDGRQRAYSGAQQALPPAAAPQNGDTEMTDAGFAAANHR